jgi:hypothetical protein
MNNTNKIENLIYKEKEDIFNSICCDVYGSPSNCPFSFSNISSKLENIDDPKIIEDIIRRLIEELNNSQNIQSCIETSSYWSYFTPDNIINAIIVVVILIMLGCILHAYFSDSLPPSSPPSSTSSSLSTDELLDEILDSVIGQPTKILDPVISQPTEILDSVISQPTEVSEPIVDLTVEVPISPEYFTRPVIGPIGPESIIGPDFQYLSPADYLYLINFANRVNEITDPAEQAELIDLMQMCINVQEMLDVLLLYF